MNLLPKKFAGLPNGIIREIIAYSGIKLKKRNGKYMVQIPKDDIRYDIIRKIPKMKVYYYPNNLYCKCYSEVHLSGIDDMHSVRMNISEFKYDEDDYIIYDVIVCDYQENRHKYEYILGDYNIRLKRLQSWLLFHKRVLLCSSICFACCLLTSIDFKLSYNLKTHIEAMHLLFY